MRRSAAVLCGAAVVLAGSLTAAPAEAGTPRAAETFHATEPLWRKCGTDDYPALQCASVEVPLDHTEPAGRRITLALSRVPHTAKNYQGPLLVNPGGPGGSGITLAGFVASTLPKKVAAQYDVIGFDPRGVGSSKPALDCKSDYFSTVRPNSLPTTPKTGARRSATGTPTRTGGSPGAPDVIISPLSAWMMLSIARPVPVAAGVAPKPEIEQ